MASEVSIRKISKENKELPTGAKILSKESRITIEQIENGYLICKSTDVRYTLGSGKETHTEYAYITKKMYSETDPFELKLNTKNKALSDIFEE